MFDHQDSVVGLWPGERPEDAAGEDDLAYILTVDELNTGWVDEERHFLPDLDGIAPGPFLAAILASVDRAKLNGYDLVRILKARERLIAHCQAGSAADTHEMAHAAPGDEASNPERLADDLSSRPTSCVPHSWSPVALPRTASTWHSTCVSGFLVSGGCWTKASSTCRGRG